MNTNRGVIGRKRLGPVARQTWRSEPGQTAEHTTIFTNFSRTRRERALAVKLCVGQNPHQHNNQRGNSVSALNALKRKVTMKIKSIIASSKRLIHTSMAFVAAISLYATADVRADRRPGAEVVIEWNQL